MDTSNGVNDTWDRTWKFSEERGWLVKSRLCGCGFLDTQRFDVQRHSSTASRLSQRIILSIGQQMGFEFRSLDVSNTFLQGMRFDELEASAKKLGIEIRTKRRAMFNPQMYGAICETIRLRTSTSPTT